MSTEEEFNPLSLLGPPPIMSSENKVKVEEEERSLYFLLRFHKANVENVQARIGKYPDEVKKKEGRYDSLPLHTALMYRASVEVVLLLINVYPEAARVDNALHLAIQWKRSKRDNLLSVVKALLDVYPEGVKERYDGRLPLASSLQMGGTDDEVLALLAAYPQAAGDKQVDLSGSDNPDAESETLQKGDPLLLLLNNKPAKVAPPLPLHYAIMDMRSQKVLKALLNAYPDAAKEKMNDGRLPIEVCAKNKASEDLMLALYKADPKSRVEGLMPLGMVLTNGSSDDVVLAVLQAYPEAASATFSTKCDVFILPLHIAHEDECSDKVKKALRDAYPGADEENPFENTLRLHKLLEDTEPDEDVLELIKNYPDAVGKRGRDGRRPLHIALVHKASQDVITTLFHKYPQAAKERMEDGRLPIEVCAERNMSKDLMLSLLKDDMPISRDGVPVEHCGSWIACVSSNTEGATGAVREILYKDEIMRFLYSDFFCDHINALADVCDDQGRTALSLAAIGPRVEINKYLLFCGRYKLFDGPPEHRTATSVVLRAQDLGEQTDYGVIFDEADDGNGKLDRKELKAIASDIGLDPDLFLKGSKKIDESISKREFVSICEHQLGDGRREVVIKLMQKKVQWESERKTRNDFDLNPKYVVSTLPNVPSDTEIADAVKEGKGGLKAIEEEFLNDIVLGKYAIVMGSGPRNLLQIFYQEQPKIYAVREILRQVFEAVKHLHEKNLMHGDIKMLNIVRLGIDNGLRLIDFDASTRIVPPGAEEESFAGAKFSSAILPPEMIERIETEEQLEEFNKYWEGENDKDLVAKVAPKSYKEQGIVKARYYVVKSFRTDEEGKPIVDKRLPYKKLERALESIDLWSLGVLAFTLLTGESLIPSTRDDDCASGNAMHLLYSWGTRSEVLSELFNKIHNVAARDLVQQLLQYEPGKRPSVASLLENHPFFNPQNADILEGINDINTQLKDVAKNRQDDRALWERIDANVVVIKKLSVEGKDELRRTRHVLLRGIFEAADVRTPTTFIILNNKLPPAADPSDEEAKNKILKIVRNEDGSGVSVTTKHATLTATEEGVGIGLEGDLKEYRDQVEAGVKWAKRIKNIGKKVAAGEIGKAFEIINKGIEDLIVGNEMYLYLIDELTGKPVRAEGEGWPIKITEPSELVHKLLPLMQLGMRAMCFYNGTAGLVRMFGYPAPKVPKEWSKGAQETVELLKQESSVGEFSVLHEEVKEGSGEKKSVRGKSLRTFVDFLKEKDPGLKVGKTGHFAGLQIIGDPEEGTAVWTMLTDPGDIESALKERAKQRREEQCTQNEHNRQQKEAQEQISETEEVPSMTTKETSTNQTRNTPKDMVTEEVDTRNNVVASEEIVELTKAAKEATASAKEATAAAKEATAAVKDVAIAAAKEAVSASSAGKACCAIM